MKKYISSLESYVKTLSLFRYKTDKKKVFRLNEDLGWRYFVCPLCLPVSKKKMTLYNLGKYLTKTSVLTNMISEFGGALL